MLIVYADFKVEFGEFRVGAQGFVLWEFGGGW